MVEPPPWCGPTLCEAASRAQALGGDTCAEFRHCGVPLSADACARRHLPDGVAPSDPHPTGSRLLDQQ